MWYYARTICVLLLGLALSVSASAQELRIGYVDMKEVLDSAPQVIAGRAKLDQEFRSRNDAIEMDELRGSALEQRLQQGDMTDESRLQMERELREIRRNVSSTEAFRKRLFRWFNAFRFLKFAQFASRNYYPRVPVLEAARDMASGSVSKASAGCESVIELLDWYRCEQR